MKVVRFEGRIDEATLPVPTAIHTSFHSDKPEMVEDDPGPASQMHCFRKIRSKAYREDQVEDYEGE